MTTLLLPQAIGLFALLLCSAFFSSSEIAFFSLDPHQVGRIKEKHPKVGASIAQLIKDPTQLLSTILIGNTIINIGASILGFRLIAALLPGGGEWASVSILTLLLLVMGEFGPKRIAMRWPERTAMLYAPILHRLTQILKPLRRMLELITDRLQHIFEPRSDSLTIDEFKTVIKVSGQSGVLDEQEHTMTQGVLSLATNYASDAMTPRVDLFGIDLDEHADTVLDIARRAKCRHLILYHKNLDQIVGLLNVRKYLLDPEHRLDAATQAPLYVPEQATLDKLLTLLLTERERIAIVVDEYGGTSGIISRGDILEEITGELADEFRDTQAFEQLTPQAWLVDGGLSIEDFNRRTNLRLEAENADRIAGWFAEKAEHLPTLGELIEANGVKAMVRKMRKQRITLVLIEQQRQAVKNDT